MEASVEDYFQSVFGSVSCASGEAPGRVNLIGEHTDYNGGLVLPTAIDRSVQVAISAGHGSEDLICSSKYGKISNHPTGAAKSGNWSDYAIGALAKARSLGLIDRPVNLAILSALPSGAGVSSSAALVTAVLRAACNMAGSTIEPLTLAHAARAIENDFIGVPCGIMDQMAVGLAAPGQALAIETSTTKHETITIPSNFTFVTLHTGIRRELNDGRYKKRFQECEAAKSKLGVEHLCLIGDEKMASVERLPRILQARTKHVISEHHRTCRARDALKVGDLNTFGELMNQSHTSYALDFKASTPEIDRIVQSAQIFGALGARLTGGGFGGCIVALLNPQDVTEWVRAMKTQYPDAWLI